MRDFELKTASTYDDPLGFPGCCELCGSQKLPLLDTRVTRPSAGGVTPGGEPVQGYATEIRIYICDECFLAQAETWGVAKGEKHRELMEAGQRLAEARSEVEALQKRVYDYDRKEIAAQRRIETLEEDLNLVNGRCAQLQQRLDQVAQDVLATASAVGGDG